MDKLNDKLPRLDNGKLRRQETERTCDPMDSGRRRRSATSKDVITAASSTLHSTPRSGRLNPHHEPSSGRRSRAPSGMNSLPSIGSKPVASASGVPPCPRMSTRDMRATAQNLHSGGMGSFEATFTVMGGWHGAWQSDWMEDVFKELLDEVLRVQIYEACRDEADQYIKVYHLPDDGLNLEDHLWIDITTPVVAEEIAKMLQECFLEISHEYIIDEWAHRILNQILQDRNNVVVSTAASIAEEVLNEHQENTAATALLDDVVTAIIHEVTNSSFCEANAVSSEMMRDTDYAEVNVYAADQIMNGIATRHLLGLLGTGAIIWDFGEFCNTVFLNHMFGEATFEHVREVQESVLDKPYWGSVRSDVTGEVAIDHLLEQLSIIGAKPLVEIQAVLQPE